MRSLLPLFVIVVALTACGGPRQELDLAQSSYDEARYEDVIVWLEDLEHERHGFGERDLARYHYLRGMAEYRVGHRVEALHQLALARAIESQHSGSLEDGARRIMEQTLEELTPRERTHLPPPPPSDS